MYYWNVAHARKAKVMSKSMLVACLTLIELLICCPCTSSNHTKCNISSAECDRSSFFLNNAKIQDETYISGAERSDVINYPLDVTLYKRIDIPENASVTVSISNINKNEADFLVAHAHSQMITLTIKIKNPETLQEEAVHGLNPALVVMLSNYNDSDPIILLENSHHEELSVVLIVRNYTNVEPIPGGLYSKNSSEPFPHPYLSLKLNLLTTRVSFPLASLLSVNEPSMEEVILSNSSKLKPAILVPSSAIKYSVYLSYLYEGNFAEDHYLEAVVEMSTFSGLEKYATQVTDLKPLNTSAPELLFVSYSGVGAVVNVLASFNGSVGSLYSTAIFYGCDFIPGEEYNCTKLVSNFAKLVCACCPFFGFFLLFVGHRWLNLTMFMSGLLSSWFLLFSIFVQVPNVHIQVLGICTLVAAICCGIGWLVTWHWYKRPFLSALLLILLSSLFTAMISTHFLKYAMVPNRHNIAAFIVFPIAFALLIVSYSIFDIKKTHIFSCCILGSYLLIVPFAFYFGSSLTYIVINVISLIAIPKFSDVIGYPPFQFCDIILLCAWIILFMLGMVYQFYRERSSPPFHPPNTVYLNVFIRAYDVIGRKVKSLFFDEFGSRRSILCCSCCNDSFSNFYDAFGSYRQIIPDGDASWCRLRVRGCLDSFRNLFRSASRTDDSQEQLNTENSD